MYHSCHITSLRGQNLFLYCMMSRAHRGRPVKSVFWFYFISVIILFSNYLLSSLIWGLLCQFHFDTAWNVSVTTPVLLFLFSGEESLAATSLLQTSNCLTHFKLQGTVMNVWVKTKNKMLSEVVAETAIKALEESQIGWCEKLDMLIQDKWCTCHSPQSIHEQCNHFK